MRRLFLAALYVTMVVAGVALAVEDARTKPQGLECCDAQAMTALGHEATC
jgi:hypothetical protein